MVWKVYIYYLLVGWMAQGWGWKRVEGRQWTFSISKECGSMCWLNSVTVYLFYRCHRIRTLKMRKKKEGKEKSLLAYLIDCTLGAFHFQNDGILKWDILKNNLSFWKMSENVPFFAKCCKQCWYNPNNFVHQNYNWVSKMQYFMLISNSFKFVQMSAKNFSKKS